jgi:hypothetical protein
MKTALLLTASLAASAASAATLDQNLSSYGQSVLKTVSNGREVHLYHWAYLTSVLAGKDAVTPLDSSDDRVKSYLGYLRDQTFSTGNGYGVAGPGIYAAIDPVATCGYGGCLNPAYSSSPGVVVQFVLTPGVAFLDGMSPRAGFPSELATQIQQAGCPATDLTSLFAYAATTACRDARDRLIAATGASALRYSYSAAYFASCPNRISAAFVLFGDEAIHWDRIVDFTSSLPSYDDGHAENRLILESVFAQAGSSYDGMPWAALKGQSPRATDVAAWMSRNLMGCGNWPEDQAN